MDLRGFVDRIGSLVRASYANHSVAWPATLVLAVGCSGGASGNTRSPLPTPEADVTVTIALLHMAPELGRRDHNVAKIEQLVEESLSKGAKIVVAPELATTGYSITAQEVSGSLGSVSPFPELDRIRDLAASYAAYVYVGVAERTPSTPAFNSVVIFGPGGLLGVERKRGTAPWHARGDLPFKVVPTPYGELAAVICSDTYLPDWVRIATLQGADVVVAPANWWGAYEQEAIWATRARENGVWMAVANRWGKEIDRRGPEPYVYDMNDAPSVVIDPQGRIRLRHRAMDMPAPADEILYATLSIPRARIGTKSNPTDTVANRRPQAYPDLAGPCFAPSAPASCETGLPPAGKVGVRVLSYVPRADPAANLDVVAARWGDAPAELVVLPALGISGGAAQTPLPDWSHPPWSSWREFVERKGVQLLVTTILERPSGTGARESLLVLEKGRPPRTIPAIHAAAADPGSGRRPELVDLPGARVGLLTGHDAVFPEIGVALAKAGADIVAISSSLASAGGVWDKEALLSAWKTETNAGFHLAASDAAGFGLLVESGGTYRISTTELSARDPVKVLALDTPPVRGRKLNVYYPFDLGVLLGQRAPPGRGQGP
ncbi:nitrilase-related carbon-nitrogen hydrolase [Sorangium sp. So ce1036]|uniref:nitrilase-related carbon-nitrogen hydrolase n=1 Tax=Sorangium sp. So ce1036 TaxID=3133328 RepID=UPI003F097F9E